MDDFELLAWLVTSIFVAAFTYLLYLAEERRRKGMARVARLLGLTFSPDRNDKIADELKFFPDLNMGSDRHAKNVLWGAIDGYPVRVFDFHYRVGSGDNEVKERKTVFLILMPRVFPDLSVTPEGFLDKVAQALGSDDIDFASHAFSDRYKVKSPDKKFAYDFCNAQMIDYLLDIPTVRLELRQNAMKLSYTSARPTSQLVKPKFFEAHLRKLLKIRSLMPDYLFAETDQGKP